MSNSVPGTLGAWTALTRSRCATVAILLSFLGISAYAGPNTKVTTSGFVLNFHGKPFAIKGMNYAPVPIGVLPGDDPFGDYFVPNFANVWKPDIDKIRAAGVNVIKLYAGNPDLNAGAPGSAGAWKQFLDYCYNGGNNPVYVIMFSFTLGPLIEAGGTDFKNYKRQYTELVESTVTHPAVFGYLIGNEIFDALTGSAQFWINFGKLFDTAETAGLSQGKKPFLTTAITDDFTPQKLWPAIKLGEESGQLTNLDAWGINIYRGPDLGVPGNSPFTQYADLMQQLGLKKPMILGEFGTPHTTRPAPSFYGNNVIEPLINLDDVPPSRLGPGQPYYDAKEVGAFLTGLWKRVTGNIGAKNAQVCVGGFIFEWSDEYWKAGNQFRSKQVGGPNPNFLGGAFAGSYGDEAGYGVTSDVDASAYGIGKPNISRTLFKGYEAVKDFYKASSHSGGELY
jgi:hypothetical protein